MAEIIFVKQTKYQNTCTKCGKIIPQGSPSWWEKGSKNNYHENHKPDASSNGIQKEGYVKPPQSNAPSKSPSFDILSKVHERLREAKGIVDAEFPGASQTSDYMTLISETMHQLFAEDMAVKIQSGKEKNIAAIR